MKRMMLAVAMVLAIGCGGEAEGLPDCPIGQENEWSTDLCSASGHTTGNPAGANGYCVEFYDGASGVKMRPIQAACVRHFADGTAGYCDASPTAVGQCGTVVCTGTTCTEAQ